MTTNDSDTQSPFPSLIVRGREWPVAFPERQRAARPANQRQVFGTVRVSSLRPSSLQKSKVMPLAFALISIAP